MATTRPPWADKYLLFSAWTQDELRNLLCGLPPHPPDDAPLDPSVPTRPGPADAVDREETPRKAVEMAWRQRQKTADAYVRDEARRVDADRHIHDAILAGDLKVLEPPDERLLAKIKADLVPEEWEALKRALAHHRTCNKAYRFERDAAIRWAAPRRDLFPDFPFNIADLRPAGGGLSSGPASPELKGHRRRLIKQALGDKSQADFCREHKDAGLTTDILRAVVNGDARRADVASWTPKVLTLLSISKEDWNAA